MRKMNSMASCLGIYILHLAISGCSDESQTSYIKDIGEVTVTDDAVLFDENLLDLIPRDVDLGGPINLKDLNCTDSLCSAKFAFDGRTYSLGDLQNFFNTFDGQVTIKIRPDEPDSSLPDQLKPCKDGEWCTPISIASGVDPDNGSSKDVSEISKGTSSPRLNQGSLKGGVPSTSSGIPSWAMDISPFLNVAIPDVNVPFGPFIKQQQDSMMESISQINSQPDPGAVLAAIVIQRGKIGEAYGSFRSKVKETLTAALAELDQDNSKQKFAATLVAINSGRARRGEKATKRLEQSKAAKAELPTGVPAGYNNLRSSPNSIIGQRIRQSLIETESLKNNSSSMTEEQKKYLSKAIDILFAVDIESGTTTDQDLKNRILTAKGLIDLAAGKKVNWKEVSAKKIECQGKAVSEREKNRLRTAEYAKLYLADPEVFKWPGMAAYTSDLVGIGIDVGGFLRNYPDYAGVVQETEKFMAAGNAAVFNDIYWQFEAYNAGGIEELKRQAAAGTLSESQLEGWIAIDKGRQTGNQILVWQGNKILLQYEQFVTLQPIYEKFPELSKLLSPFMISPIPGGMDPFQVNVPGGNIGNRDDRWSWITGSMLPAYQALSDQNRDKVLRDLTGLISDSAGVCK